MTHVNIKYPSCTTHQVHYFTLRTIGTYIRLSSGFVDVVTPSTVFIYYRYLVYSKIVKDKLFYKRVYLRGFFLVLKHQGGIENALENSVEVKKKLILRNTLTHEVKCLIHCCRTYSIVWPNFPICLFLAC